MADKTEQLAVSDGSMRQLHLEDTDNARSVNSFSSISEELISTGNWSEIVTGDDARHHHSVDSPIPATRQSSSQTQASDWDQAQDTYTEDFEVGTVSQASSLSVTSETGHSLSHPGPGSEGYSYDFESGTDLAQSVDYSSDKSSWPYSGIHVSSRPTLLRAISHTSTTSQQYTEDFSSTESKEESPSTAHSLSSVLASPRYA